MQNEREIAFQMNLGSIDLILELFSSLTFNYKTKYTMPPKVLPFNYG